MILIYCPSCHDARSITSDHRVTCGCGKAWGEYHEDKRSANISAETVPIGISNGSLLRAIERRPTAGMGISIDVLVLPLKSDFLTVDYLNSIRKEQSDEPGNA